MKKPVHYDSYLRIRLGSGTKMEYLEHLRHKNITYSRVHRLFIEEELKRAKEGKSSLIDRLIELKEQRDECSE